jgi:hypothetical protein
MICLSCAPPKKVDLDESRLCKPQDLTIDSIANNYTRIAWNPGCPGIRVMRGFNIYLSPVPQVSKYTGRELPKNIRAFNSEIYPGDSEGKLNRETYEIENIDNATRYYVHVRAVYNDGSLSVPSNEIELLIYQQGTIELDVSYSGNQAGYSFVKDRPCKTDALENDIYYYHKDGIDYICSPSRIGPVNRNNKIYAAGSGNQQPDPDNLNVEGNSVDRIAVIPGQNLLIDTEEDYKVGLFIVGFEGAESDRRVVFEYFYKPPVRQLDS